MKYKLTGTCYISGIEVEELKKIRGIEVITNGKTEKRILAKNCKTMKKAVEYLKSLNRSLFDLELL